MAVEPGGEVGVAVEQVDMVGGDVVSGDGDEAHQDPVPGKRGDCQSCFAPPGRADEIQRRNDEVADGYAREYSIEAHGVEMEGREAVHDQA